MALGDASTILEAAVLEGCIAEVISAECARIALERAEGRSIQEVMSRIAEDEARHAELSWRIVRWLLEENPNLQGAAATAFRKGLSDSQALPAETIPEDLPETYGCLREGTRRKVRERTIEQLIRPRASRLLSSRMALTPS